jgi:branched-chain amino acid transport system substrate-binding protein
MAWSARSGSTTWRRSAVATVERNSVDVSQAVQQIAAVNPQAVIMVTLYKPTAAFVRAMKKAGQKPQFMTLSPVGADLLVQELGDEARGIGISQVMPYPWNDTTPLVREYQKLLGQQGKPSYYGVEAYAMAKSAGRCDPQGWQGADSRKAGPRSRSMQNHDLGGYRVSYSANERRGSRFVDLTVIGNSGRVLR